jgi:hypothetical protein
MYTKLPYPVVSRLLAFMIAPPYLLAVAAMLSATTGIAFQSALIAVVCGAAVIMVVLGIVSVKVLNAEGPLRRFSLSSALLLAVPLAVYLAGLRYVLAATVSDELPVVAWFFIATLSLVFMIVTTSILLCLAEAIVWVCVAIFRGTKAYEDGRDTPERSEQ